MRDQLKNLTEKDYWVYGVTETDFDHAINIVREMIDARTEQYKSVEKRVRTESSDVADEVLDDVAYYRYTDNQYLWQFSLWRLQGLLEAVITNQLIESRKVKKLNGFKAKIEALQSFGYRIEQEEIDELLLWSRLRNAVSHAPPEEFFPAPIFEEDIVEYHGLVKELYLRWQKEKANASNG
jgi:hypothetical protein